MTDDAFEAFQAIDRPHSLPPDSYKRIEQAMIDACIETHENPADMHGGQTLIILDTPESPRQESKHGGRAIWLAVAAGLIFVVLASVQLTGTGDGTAPAGSTILGNYCDEYLEPLADELDLLRVNPTQSNTIETHRLLGLALEQLDQSQELSIDVSDLAASYERLPVDSKASTELIDITSLLGQRVSSLTSSSPRCRYDRLASNKTRLTDPLGRPTGND